MSKNRKVRNAKVIRKLLSATIPFDTRFMVTGQVYQYQLDRFNRGANGWLFCLRADGTLGTDNGRGLSLLSHDHVNFSDDNQHWCRKGRVVKALRGVTLPV